MRAGAGEAPPLVLDKGVFKIWEAAGDSSGHTRAGIGGWAAASAYGVNAATTHTWIRERGIHIVSAARGPGLAGTV